jgi:ribonuclease R
MSKLKLRYRNEIIQVLSKSQGPISLKVLMRELFPKEEIPKMERLIVKELRFLVKLKEVEKGSGNMYRLRPPKNSRARVRKEREHDFEERELRMADRELQDMKRDMEDADVAPRGNKRDRTIIQGKVSKNARGFAFVAPINPPPFLKEDVFLNPEEAEELLTGDIVEITLDAERADKGYSGRLRKVVERGMTKTVARYVKSTPYASAMAEVDTKDVHLQILLEKDPTFKDTVDGAAILVEITAPPSRDTPAQGRILSVLADSLNSTTDDAYILTKHKLSETFPDNVMAEAQAVPSTLKKSDLKGREDLRDLPFVTIDGADSRDFDDAVCAKRMPGGITRLWVAIADVAHYVVPGSAIDDEAYKRGTSVYFPHRVLPMLPERLSNGICSLNPHEDRLVMVAEIDFDAAGKKVRHKVLEGVFQSHHRCIYETLQQYFDRPNDADHDYSPQVKESLNHLYDLYMKLHASRIRRGAIDLNLPEAKVKINRESGEVDAIVRSERLDTHRLIEELMIVANEAVAEIMEENKLGFIFRVHETPEPEAAKRFLDVSKSLHVRVNEGWIEELTPQTYQKMLKAIEESPAARVLNFLLLRSMKQAYYSSENLFHFGLASKSYSHFTSPIRRYPDLIGHRLLKAYLHKSKKEAQAAGGPAKDVAEAALHCSQRERVAVDAERELVRIKQIRYAERHLGEEHTGTVTSISAKGAYLELESVFVEGFVPIERFGDDFAFNDRLYNLRGKRSGKIVQIGDKIEVQIVRTNPHLQQIELDPLNGKPKRSRAEIQRLALEEAGAMKGRLREPEPRPSFRRKEREERSYGEERTGGQNRGARAERGGGRLDREERGDRGDRGDRAVSGRGERERSGKRAGSRDRASERSSGGGDRPRKKISSSSRDNDRDRPRGRESLRESREERSGGRGGLERATRERDNAATTSRAERALRETEKRFPKESLVRSRAADKPREKEEKKEKKDADTRDFWKPEDFE